MEEKKRCIIPNCKKRGACYGKFGTIKLVYCNFHIKIGEDFFDRVNKIKAKKGKVKFTQEYFYPDYNSELEQHEQNKMTKVIRNESRTRTD